ncbi:hypothetical protein F8564_01160 [Serratia sp. RJAL6]|nr:hypothetical protein F8564_01160 [Enterobacter sp. RJAL6]
MTGTSAESHFCPEERRLQRRTQEMSLICSYCEPAADKRESEKINASPLSLNVGRPEFSFAVNVSQKNG